MITHDVARWMAERAIEDMPELDDRYLDEWGIDRHQADRAHDLAVEARPAFITQSDAAATLHSIGLLHASTQCDVCGRTYEEQPDPICDCGSEGEEFYCSECNHEYPCATRRTINREKYRDNP